MGTARTRRLRGHCVILLVGALSCGCGNASSAPPDAGPVFVEPDERDPCSDHDPLRRPLWGDLHVHTHLSFDAAVYNVRATVADAYAYAQGQAIGGPPYTAGGTPSRMLQIDRPLDFAAVTDHSEFLAETAICTDSSLPGYDSPTCVSYRGVDPSAGAVNPFVLTLISPVPRRPTVCPAGDCTEGIATAWEEIRDAAEAAYDRTSACTFTTLIGYEWTGSAAAGNLHRNVLFRNRAVPRQVFSYVEATTAEQLWSALETNCLNTGTPCDVLAIPHNSNLGGGVMFVPETDEGSSYTAAEAERRARLEPVAEIYQHKGASECTTGVPDPLASDDPLCAFEPIVELPCTGGPDVPPGCTPLCDPDGGGGGGFLGACLASSDFLRATLRRGLAEWARVGANPFELGFLGSTDTHGATPGAVDEASWQGHVGEADDEGIERLLPAGLTVINARTSSPGGLAGVWAEENSREAIFDALRRRETFGTSGPRIALRFFGGWDLPDTLCGDPSLAQTGYDQGVPMGGRLSTPAASAAPTFVLDALRDPMGGALQRIQIVKGWFDGVDTQETVYEVGGDPSNGATVDPATCAVSGPGSDGLCAHFTDPAFDPARPAFYYARVVENPSCRWSQRVCNDLAPDCGAVDPGTPEATCCDPAFPRTIQERAWSSPIWYLP